MHVRSSVLLAAFAAAALSAAG
ncbi:MAG: hypothetical protein JWO38_4113, partial [Gemmataceae bacterium]|nr:hypothetical protein [Gemmataceae bacterium]